MNEYVSLSQPLHWATQLQFRKWKILHSGMIWENELWTTPLFICDISLSRSIFVLPLGPLFWINFCVIAVSQKKMQSEGDEKSSKRILHASRRYPLDPFVWVMQFRDCCCQCVCFAVIRWLQEVHHKTLLAWDHGALGVKGLKIHVVGTTLNAAQVQPHLYSTQPPVAPTWLIRPDSRTPWGQYGGCSTWT